MKNRFLKILLCIILLISLCSCDKTKVTKTEEITDKITQTSVVLNNDAVNQEEYKDFFKKFKKEFLIPGLFEGIIPQGFCYDDTTGYFIITGYYEDSKLPSMVITVDSKTSELIGAHALKTVNGEPYYGHVGGIGSSQNTVYIACDYECFAFPSDLLIETPNGSPIQFQSVFKVNSIASFLTVHNDVLWIGDFVQSTNKARNKIEDILTLESGETFYAFCEGYSLENGIPSQTKVNSTRTGYIPDYILAIPEQAQGIAFTITDKIIFSTSYGRSNDSKLYIYDDVLSSEKAGTRIIDGIEVDIFACADDKLIEEITAPPMTEDLAIHTNGIYVIFESGAAKYRNGGGKYTLENAYYINIE